MSEILFNCNSCQWIGFDADDTLWYDNKYFRVLRTQFESICLDQNISKVDISIALKEALKEVFGENGYIKALLKAEENLGLNNENKAKLDKCIDEFSSHPIEILPNLETSLSKLKDIGYELILISKGNEVEQHKKILNSGLINYFEHIYIVREKTKDTYLSILENKGINVNEFIYFGNNIKDDVIPILEIGATPIWFNHDLNYNKSSSALPNDIIEMKSWDEISKYI